MTAPLVLQIANEPVLSDSSRFVRAFGTLAAEGLISHTALSPVSLLPAGFPAALEGTRAALRGLRPDAVFVQSPGAFPWTPALVRELLASLGNPPVVCWEGDAWGGRKRLPAPTAAWLGEATTVFSVALGPQRALLGQHTDAPVRYVPNVLPLPCDDTPVPPPAAARADAVLMGNRYVRLGFLERVDGNLDRARVVRGLRSLPGCRLAVHGTGWRGRGALGPVPYERQPEFLRHGRIAVGWDHFHHYAGFYSDRMPISFHAGRPLVNSRQPDLDWLPGPDHGLHLAATPTEAVHAVRDLLTADPEALHAAALRGRAWVRERLTDHEALLHMLGFLVPLPAPPADPWRAFDRDPVGV